MIYPEPKSDHWLKVWSRFLDSVARLPESRRMYHISQAVWAVDVLYNHFSEEELTQLTKFETKTNIFKIDLEEWR